MKILFLTSSPGYGHTRAAEAIGFALQCEYPHIETRYLDVTELLDPQASKALQDGYLRMTAEYPELYQKLYNLDENFYRQLAGKIPADDDLIEFLTEQQRRSYPEEFERTLFMLPVAYKSLDGALLNTLINGICNRNKMPVGRLLSQGLLALIFRILSARVKKFVSEYDPDCIVATQMYPNALLSRYVKNGSLRQPIVGVLTDYGVHGVWVRETTSLYCVGHQDVADALQQQGVPSHCIRVTGIPLVPAFENIPSQQRAREKLKLGNLPTILITGGQCGIGVAPVLQQLLDDPDLQCQILVTAGSNSADQDKLRYLATRYPTRFHLFGWHSDMRDLFCAADMVVGKPGGLTVSESLACGKPFIATCCLGGQELHNVNHLQKNGAGMLVGQAELGQTIRNLLNNPQQLQAMSQQALSLGQPRAANNVVRELERLMSLKKTPESQALVVAASGSA
jgi:processive 1,2-diacylglycerol beta-glucosyltransferase